MATRKLSLLGKWLLLLLLALAPVVATGCQSTGGRGGSVGSDGHVGHSH